MKTVKKTHTPEFTEEAVKRVLAQGVSTEQAAVRVSVPKWTLANWIVATKRGTEFTADPGSRSVAQLGSRERVAAQKAFGSGDEMGYRKKKRLLTLRWSRCQVCVDKTDATRFS